MTWKQNQRDYLGKRKGPAGEREDKEGWRGQIWAKYSDIYVWKYYQNPTILYMNK